MDFSFSEILMICVIAFLVFGPEEFIRRSNQLGRMIGKLKTQAQNFRVMVEEEIAKSQNEEVQGDDDGKT
jgi:Sec-independent protein translocase protein TatA